MGRHRRDYCAWGIRGDIELRNAALEHVRELQRRYDDLVPVRALVEDSAGAA